MPDFATWLQHLRDLLEVIEGHAEGFRALRELLDSFRLLLAVALGSATRILVAALQARRGGPPGRTLGQRVGGGLISLAFCAVASAALATAATRAGVPLGGPGTATRAIRLAVLALAVIASYNAASIVIHLAIALFLGRAGLTAVILTLLMLAALAILNATPSWPPARAAWRSPTHVQTCDGGSYQLDGVPVVLQAAAADTLLFRHPSGLAFEVGRDGRFAYQVQPGGPLVAGYGGRWEAP